MTNHRRLRTARDTLHKLEDRGIVENNLTMDQITAIRIAEFAIDEICSTDVQPVDTKEIIRHLDSLMICVGNAYDTSHGLLQSDMEFIEKQEKIIKGLLSGKTIKG